MYTIENIRNHIIGIDNLVTVLNGENKPYIYFDNGASAPSFDFALDKVAELLEYYSAAHRGAGIKSLVATRAYDDAHEIVLDFFGYDKEANVAIFVKNTTEALNKLSYRLDIAPDEWIITSHMEHHSNFLPWFKHHKNVEFVDINADGSLNIDDLYSKIDAHKGKLRLVSVTGASNVSGIINPIYDIARRAHEAGAQICVDAAQLAPHRKITVGDQNALEHIDFLAISAHKIYAPYGTGVLIGPKEVFLKGDPEYVGGGMAKAVTPQRIIWSDLPDKEEAGSPNILGAVGLAAALKVLEEVGMDKVAEHEDELTTYLHDKLDEIPEIELFSPIKCDGTGNKVGVVTFTIKDVPYELAAAVLCYEGGFGVRAGCFCAHPYIRKALNVTDAEMDELLEKIENNKRVDLPGALRISFGIYNAKHEVDELVIWLKRIIAGDYEGEYILEENSGRYAPKNFDFDAHDYFNYKTEHQSLLRSL